MTAIAIMNLFLPHQLHVHDVLLISSHVAFCGVKGLTRDAYWKFA